MDGPIEFVITEFDCTSVPQCSVFQFWFDQIKTYFRYEEETLGTFQNITEVVIST